MRLPSVPIPGGTISLPRATALGSLGLLLIVADVLPENRYLDLDVAKFALSVALGLTALTIALRDRLEASDLRVWSQRALLFVITVLGALGAAELMTRWAFRDVTTSSDYGGYFTRRWLRTNPIHKNAAGFRGPEFSATKPAGAYRIAIVGDSFTQGNGVRQEDRFSDLLDAMLPAHFEVLNFGVAGNNTPEHLEVVTTVLANAHPDFVLLQWYVNDMEDDDTTGRPSFRPLVPVPSLHRWLTMESALYNVVNVPWSELQVTTGMTRSYPAYLYQRLGDPNGHDAAVDKRFLMAIIDRCREASVPLGIVLFPDTAAPIDRHYPFGYLHDRVLRTCRDHELTCVDLRDDFGLVKDHRQLWASRLDHHPSARAHAIAAERILKTYAAKWAN
ncbi:MAG TPA: GDSL-type esterase/lipase family protein [Vicinamibacterales bacterium]|nr:GDSL-type esterase/lipase family protein [Vicinamibacterales bacterium]